MSVCEWSFCPSTVLSSISSIDADHQVFGTVTSPLQCLRFNAYQQSSNESDSKVSTSEEKELNYHFVLNTSVMVGLQKLMLS